ncbi:hypothetical protein [Streptomyces radicis]|uniref:DUF3558 domain-containing protein n=1 Tax=Streptomyces radicis TaxID=1750517 RepID=A0A3A9VVN9_9ACTN|nr:hypothetical protein [Streptomyces radicis]RKN05071.1 hypothetical protein D7319_26250 [Streptomyces radicis]RKN16397.1 hypothetical protein D7318_25615 [Streptomyces radicis]
MSALLLSATACTSGGGEQGSDEDEYNMTADEVCQGTLAGSADSLEARARSEEFGEIDMAPSYTPADYADVLMENNVTPTNLCVIYAPVRDRGEFASIKFSWFDLVPTPGEDRRLTYYDVDAYASTSDQYAAMFVNCPVGAAPPDELLWAELAVQTPGSGSDHDDMIAILNSATYTVVDALGCTEESGLTPEPPARWEAPA